MAGVVTSTLFFPPSPLQRPASSLQQQIPSAFVTKRSNKTHHEVAQLGVKLREASRGEEDDDLVSHGVGGYVLAQKLAQLLRLRTWYP